MAEETSNEPSVPTTTSDAAPVPADSSTKETPNERSQEEQLTDLTAQATASYAKKEYRNAAELYSRATELQAAINGEMSSLNADLLYCYGRCLYHVAVQKSDVLGPKVAGEAKPAATAEGAESKQSTKAQSKDSKSAANATSKPNEAATSSSAGATSSESAGDGKPFFQFQGDENFDVSDEEDDEGEGEEAGDDEDEFQNAFEILDLARVLLQRRIDEFEADTVNLDKHLDDVRQLRERLADTYDLQAEISLESEQFAAAVKDLRSALEIKTSLYPAHSSLLAELYYKLSLALEFAAVHHPRNAAGEVDESQEPVVDAAMREEAVQAMLKAISSCTDRIKLEQAALDAGETGSGRSKITQSSIDDVKDMVKDMQVRLAELKQAPVSINKSMDESALDVSANSLLGQLLGKSSDDKKATLAEASKQAHDLSGLVRKKKAPEAGRSDTPESSSKRAREVEPEADSTTGVSNPAKKSKTDE